MKFIKTQDGVYVNANHIECFSVDGINGCNFFVNVESRDEFYTVNTFDTRAEAEKYLEELITRLETEAK